VSLKPHSAHFLGEKEQNVTISTITPVVAPFTVIPTIAASITRGRKIAVKLKILLKLIFMLKFFEHSVHVDFLSSRDLRKLCFFPQLGQFIFYPLLFKATKRT